jgi:hypothetical protein
MKNHFFLLLLTLFVSIQSVEAQIEYHKKYFSTNNAYHPQDFQLHVDGGVTAVGQYDTWAPSSCLFRTDALGEIVFSRDFQSNGALKLSKLELIHDTLSITIGNVEENGGISSGIILCTDAQGDTLWTNRLVHANFVNTSLRDVAQLNDTTILLTGSTGVCGFLAAVHTNGTLLWSKLYQSQWTGSPELVVYALQVTSNDRVVLTGHVISNSQMFGAVLNLNEQGDVLWSLNENNVSSYREVASVGSQLFFLDYVNQKMFSLDSNGTELWTGSVPGFWNEFDDVESTLKEFDGGTLLFCGHYGFNGAVLRMDTSGNCLNYTEVYGKSFKCLQDSLDHCYIMSAGPIYGIKSAQVLQPHGGISRLDSLTFKTFCTYPSQFNSQSLDVLHVTHNVLVSGQLQEAASGVTISNGSMVSEDGCIDALGMLSEQEQASFRLYPNPVHNEVNIQLEGEQSMLCQMVDVYGKVVHSFRVQSGENIASLQMLPSGFYVAVIGNYRQRFSKISL